MGFQTRQIRTGKLQHKRWDGKCKGYFCFSWLLCPNDGLNLYSTPIVWMYEAVFASSSYSVPSSVKSSWMSAGFCRLLFSSQQSGHLKRWWQGCIFCIFVFHILKTLHDCYCSSEVEYFWTLVARLSWMSAAASQSSSPRFPLWTFLRPQRLNKTTMPERIFLPRPE